VEHLGSHFYMGLRTIAAVSVTRDAVVAARPAPAPPRPRRLPLTSTVA
jgi:hypothetical protein